MLTFPAFRDVLKNKISLPEINMQNPYIKDYQVLWSDLDGNMHMKNTSYLEYASNIRMTYFFDMGFPPKKMLTMGVGPVAVRDEILYLKEIQLMEQFKVSLQLDGLSEDQSKMRLINIFTNEKGVIFGKVTSDGVWFNLLQRKVMPPPEEIKELMLKLPRSETYSVIQ